MRTTLTLPGTWTVEEFLQLGETTTPCELINGKVVISPSAHPNHQLVSSHLSAILLWEAEKIGADVWSPIDLFIDDTNVFEPDLMVILKENQQYITDRGFEGGAPELVVEILSPSSKRRDRNIKRERYLQIGVKEYWIVDIWKRSIEIHTASAPSASSIKRFAIGDVLTSTVLPTLSVDVSYVFRNLR